MTKSKELDQFYTAQEYARSFLDKISNILDLTSYDHLLEPSAGTGSFYNLLDCEKRIGLDLDPKADGIIKTDFFDWAAPLDKKIATIGNPPFGKNASLAVKFFNQSAKFSDAIAFIIPRTFRKASIINRLDKNFHLVYDETVPDNSFIYEDNHYNVWCCAQIWIRKDTQRKDIPTIKLEKVKDWFEIVDANQSDFSVQRVGGRAGQIRIEDRAGYSPLSNYFIKAHDPRVLPIFEKIDFDDVKYNTAGNPSISPSELAELWIAEAAKEGITVDLLDKIDNNLFESV